MIDLERAKIVLRITHNQLDSDIQDSIAAGASGPRHRRGPGGG